MRGRGPWVSMGGPGQNKVQSGRHKPWAKGVGYLLSLLFVIRGIAFSPRWGVSRQVSALNLPFFSPLGAKASEEEVIPARSHSRKKKAVRERRNASRRSVQGLGRATPTRPHREHQSGVKMVSTLERCR